MVNGLPFIIVVIHFAMGKLGNVLIGENNDLFIAL